VLGFFHRKGIRLNPELRNKITLITIELETIRSRKRLLEGSLISIADLELTPIGQKLQASWLPLQIYSDISEQRLLH